MSQSLYQSGWSPPRTPRGWERTSVFCGEPGQAGDIMRRHSVPASWGDPDDAVAWFGYDEPDLRQLVADYPNGRRALLRINKRGWRLNMERRP